MDRELTRAELDELLPLFALDALEGEEHQQVVRYVEREEVARAEVSSLREAAALFPPVETRAPKAVWETIERSLDAPAPDASSRTPTVVLGSSRSPRHRTRRPVRVVAAVLAVAATVAIVALGIQVTRQQDRIDDLAAEMHGDALHQQAMSARADKDAHLIELAAESGSGSAEVVMLPDGTGYFMDHDLPALTDGSTYQLWAKVGDAAAPRMVSLGLLGRDPRTAPFHLAAPVTMFEVTKEPMPGAVTPGDAVVMSGLVT